MLKAATDLERLHGQLLLMLRDFDEVRLANPATALEKFSEFRRLADLLISHEELQLLPYVETDPEGPAAVIRVEHHQILALIEAIQVKLTEGNFRTGAEQMVLAELLSQHLDRERAFLHQRVTTNSH